MLTWNYFANYNACPELSRQKGIKAHGKEKAISHAVATKTFPPVLMPYAEIAKNNYPTLIPQSPYPQPNYFKP